MFCIFNLGEDIVSGKCFEGFGFLLIFGWGRYVGLYLDFDQIWYALKSKRDCVCTGFFHIVVHVKKKDTQKKCLLDEKKQTNKFSFEAYHFNKTSKKQVRRTSS